MPMKTRPVRRKVLAETAEARRLDEARIGVPWRRWGPYLSERQWGLCVKITVSTATPGSTCRMTMPAS
jgi:hypothetical protein